MSDDSQGRVVALFICPGYRQPMQAIAEAQAVAARGFAMCFHARPNSTRQVLLMAQEDLDAFGLRPGDVRENITTAGIDLMSLRMGRRLRVGEALLEITGECYPCTRMDELRPGLRTAIKGHRGMLARVLQGGSVRIGDAITPVERPRQLPLAEEDFETAVYPI